MSNQLLAISIGNTRTAIALIDGGRVGEVRRARNAQREAIAAAIGELWAGADPEAAVYVSSVNEPTAEQVAAIAADVTGRAPVRVERDVPIPVGRKLDPEAIVGEDRLLNAAAAYDTIKAACIIIDAGTAVTVDFIDGEGTFHGGAILPGAQLMLDALHEHTAALPTIEFAKPDEAIGHNTRQAMLDGVFHGIRGAVRELAEKYAEVYGAYPQIIATGGDAETLFTGYDLVEAIVPDLALRGIAIVHRHGAMESE